MYENLNLVEHIILLIFVSAVSSYFTTLFSRKLHRDEVAKKELLIDAISAYRDIGKKVTYLQFEAFQLITFVLLYVTRRKQEGANEITAYQEIGEQYQKRTENILDIAISLKSNYIYLPDDVISSLNEIIELYWRIFKTGHIKEFKDSKLIIEKTDTLINQIRFYTSKVMKRKKDISSIIAKESRAGYSSQMEKDVGDEVEALFKNYPSADNENQPQ